MKWRSELFQIQAEVEKVLPYKKKLWKVSETDQLRLVKLKVWEERYSVSLSYVVNQILEYHYSKLPNKMMRDKAKNSKGLGIRIATLVGNVSEDCLKASLFTDFPDGENYANQKESKRDEILELIDQELPSKRRGVLDYNRLSDFVSSYRKSIDNKKREVDKLSQKMRRMPWRGNPWL